MIQMRSPWERVTDPAKWSARGTSLIAKLKATKVVWFPPDPVETGKETAMAAKKATTRTAKTAARKTTGGAKKTKTGAAGTVSGSKDTTTRARPK